MILSAAVFCGGITWGLPSLQADSLLFGDQAAVSCRQIVDLTGRRWSAPASTGELRSIVELELQCCPF